MRRAARIDANQPYIVEALRDMGAFVHLTSAIGGGFPDLVVGWCGRTLLAEIKDPSQPPSKRQLTPDQQIWHASWTGGPLAIITDVDSAIRACRAIQGTS